MGVQVFTTVDDVNLAALHGLDALALEIVDGSRVGEECLVLLNTGDLRAGSLTQGCVYTPVGRLLVQLRVEEKGRFARTPGEIVGETPYHEFLTVIVLHRYAGELVESLSLHV